jgi:hypothetical protein
MTISEDGVREAVRSILAGNRHPGYYIDTIEACVRAVKAQAEQEAEASPTQPSN